MKVWHFVLFSFIGSLVVLGGICSHVWADAGLPDGFEVLKKKMEQNKITNVDFAKFKFDIPDNLPEEINNIKGYLWSGKYSHPVYGSVQSSTSYLFLMTFSRETGEMKFFHFWESASTRYRSYWQILAGKADTDNKDRINLKSIAGGFYTYILQIKNKDYLISRASDGWDADIKKIGIITTSNSSLAAQSFPFPSNVNISSLEPGLPVQILAFSGVWEGSWGDLLPSQLAVEKIDLKKATVMYGWVEGGFMRYMHYEAKVDEKGVIEWESRSGAKFTFTMSKNLKAIEGRREYRGDILLVTMTKKN